MRDKTIHLQFQYQGYCSTPNLWVGNTVYGLEQFNLPCSRTSKFNGVIADKLRLGKLVERFVSHDLKQHPEISNLVEGLQIQKDKITIGELDALFLFKKQPIHLEIVYKFYLYDPLLGDNELYNWIGPNRKDSLIKKLDKLKNKQLPLLFNSNTKHYLNRFNINANHFDQRVLFRAQLFLPYQGDKNIFNLINPECVQGFYIKMKDLDVFKTSKFYIPSKLDWLLEVSAHVNWLTYSKFKAEIINLITNKTSPLCWVKHPNGIIKKIFIVWWT
ncbi:DUF1853 family protein [Aestuariibaculum sediminum]|uniref:DUF1853 family protein n=1 Tax=Aestuariibaculum sediminum TaxID=2770637 RepID=A0A8J6Q2S0_9FLAO|nr:DUF1853 family protein [Aestuariibaculum sediminum]MBD0831985.1 DUF1853 family protein [Aestuariibaculum sediminum]